MAIAYKKNATKVASEYVDSVPCVQETRFLAQFYLVIEPKSGMDEADSTTQQAVMGNSPYKFLDDMLETFLLISEVTSYQHMVILISAKYEKHKHSRIGAPGSQKDMLNLFQKIVETAAMTEENSLGLAEHCSTLRGPLMRFNIDRLLKESSLK